MIQAVRPVHTATGPTTAFIHGLGGSISDTRPFARRVPGSHVFVHLRSHGGSPAATTGVTFDELAHDVLEVVQEYGATQAFGVSLGSAVLLRLITDQPELLKRVALYLPAATTAPRPSTDLQAALRSTDPHALEEYAAGELPPELAATKAGRDWLASHVAALREPGIVQLADLIAAEAPIADPSLPGAVRTELLAIGAEGDRVHPAQVARDVAQLFPHASVEVFDQPAPLWTARPRLRAMIIDFFTDSAVR